LPRLRGPEQQSDSHQYIGPGCATPNDQHLAGFRRSRKSDVLWTKLSGSVPALSQLCRQDSARGEAGRSTDRAANQVRFRHQPYHCQDARLGNAGISLTARRRGDRMIRRREFITLLGGAAAAWPLAAHAQQGERMRRVGVLMNLAADDPEAPARIAAFAQGLADLCWSIGRNLRIDYRWGAGDAERIRREAAELVAGAPDVVLASGNPSAAALQQATRSVPIVFAGVNDPVSSGFVESLAQPGGNITGFSLYEYSFSGKWLELLKELSPRVM